MSYTRQYLLEMKEIIDRLDTRSVDNVVDLLVTVRKRAGRAFFVGLGGGAGNASHAVSDFRKLAGIEAYTPVDNVSELTAQINDNGWESVLLNWLQVSRLSDKDLVFVFSVGGGSLAHNVSPNLVHALRYAREVGSAIAGIVGSKGGFTVKVADACVVIPVASTSTITPHTESFQAALWHLMVSHPRLQTANMKWESIADKAPDDWG